MLNNIVVIYKKLLKKLISPRYVRNYFRSKYKKSVLIIYTLDVFLDKSGEAINLHTNRWRNLAIANVFHKLGYRVDVINYKDVGIVHRIKRKYDIVFGLGDAYCEFVSKKKHLYGNAIYFGTGQPPSVENSAESLRLEDFKKRHGFVETPKRFNNQSESIINESDLIIALGNSLNLSITKGLYSTRVVNIDSHIDDNNDFYKDIKSFGDRKYNFLFLTGKGKVFTGLDLVLDYFIDNPSLTLHVCGGFNGEESFYDYYIKKTYGLTNIKFYGNVEMGGDELRGIVSKCGAMIMPAITGGGNGSILQGMSHGLIPILSKGCTVDIDGNGIEIENVNWEEVSGAIHDYLSKNEEWYLSRRRNIYKLSRARYSQKTFIYNFEKIIKEYIYG